jgi:hypothetical protein
MKISGLLKETKTAEIQGQKFTVKKYPLGFYEYLSAKSMEGRQVGYGEDGKPDKVNIIYTPKWDLEDFIDQLFYGLASWGLVGEDGYAVALTRETCQEFLEEYPDTAKEVLMEIVAFNRPVIQGEIKKK